MSFPDEFLSELQHRNRIEDIVGGYVNLKKAGNILKGLCPFHNEKTPSFTVYPADNSFYCFTKQILRKLNSTYHPDENISVVSGKFF